MAKVLGIDIGGTKISAIVTNEKGIILHKETAKTEGHLGQQHVLSLLINLIRNTLISQKNIESIGIGTPGYVNASEGIVVYSMGVIKDWVNIKLREHVGKHFNLPIVVENDANAAAIGEGWLGAGQNLSDYMVVTLGTSVGGAYVNKKFGVLSGHSWRGGEIGHSILYPNGKACLCGQRGCAELYLSGTALVSNFNDLGGEAKSGEDVFVALKQKDPKAVKVMMNFANDLATLLVSIQNILDPQAFIISGGLIHTKQHWWQELNSLLNLKSNKGVAVKILPAKLLNDAGALGSAKLALDLLEK